MSALSAAVAQHGETRKPVGSFSRTSQPLGRGGTWDFPLIHRALSEKSNEAWEGASQQPRQVLPLPGFSRRGYPRHGDVWRVTRGSEWDNLGNLRARGAAAAAARRLPPAGAWGALPGRGKPSCPQTGTCSPWRGRGGRRCQPCASAAMCTKRPAGGTPPALTAASQETGCRHKIKEPRARESPQPHV